MKTNLRLLAAVLCFAVSFTACTKEAKNNEEPSDESTEVTTHSDDQSRITLETDIMENDANVAIESSASFSGNSWGGAPEICGATVAYDTSGNTKKIIITYNGGACGGAHVRTGIVTLSMPKNMYWKNAGATLTISYTNLKFTRTSDRKSITLNGSHVVTNVSGGLLVNLPTLKTITHTVSSSNLSVTFDDNTQRNWQVARKRVFTYNNGIVVTITGNHSEGGVNGIAAWGTNRFGHAFTTSITQPLVIKQDCNFRLTSGAVMHQGFGIATATYGLDASGNAAVCPGSGHYYYKISWTGQGGNTFSKMLPY